MIQLFLIIFFLNLLVNAQEKPKWYTQDYKSPEVWGFYCQGDANSEDKALIIAKANCAIKICQLFGMEIKSETTALQNLSGIDVKSTVVEKCPDIRVVERKLIRKQISCDEPEVCNAYIEQTYPLEEYKKEYERLNRPKISSILEKQIIIREGNDTFKDPTKCRNTLKGYQKIDEFNAVSVQKKIGALTLAFQECKGLDYRNTVLQKELTQVFYKVIETKPNSSQMYMLKKIEDTPDLVNLIKVFLDHDTRQLQLLSKEKEYIKKLQPSFYYIFNKDVKIPDPNFEKDEDDITAESLYLNPYMRERKSCSNLKKVLMTWPGDFDVEMRLCGLHPESKSEECENTDIMMLRYRYAGCKCDLLKNGDSQKCTGQLGELIKNECPKEVTSECLMLISKVLKKKNLSIEF